MITLTIENQPSFSDGSPISYNVSGRDFKVGRASNMDWILPDPLDSLPARNLRLSRHHFEVLYNNGAYMVRDTSMHGTFIEGRSGRIQGLEILQDGMRLKAGRYFILVSISASRVVEAAPPTSAMPPGPQQTQSPSTAPAANEVRGGWVSPPSAQPTATNSNGRPLDRSADQALGQSDLPRAPKPNAWSPATLPSAQNSGITGPVSAPAPTGPTSNGAPTPSSHSNPVDIGAIPGSEHKSSFHKGRTSDGLPPNS